MPVHGVRVKHSVEIEIEDIVHGWLQPGLRVDRPFGLLIESQFIFQLPRLTQ